MRHSGLFYSTAVIFDANYRRHAALTVQMYISEIKHPGYLSLNQWHYMSFMLISVIL